MRTTRCSTASERLLGLQTLSHSPIIEPTASLGLPCAVTVLSRVSQRRCRAYAIGEPAQVTRSTSLRRILSLDRRAYDRDSSVCARIKDPRVASLTG